MKNCGIAMTRFLLCLILGCLLGCAHHKKNMPEPIPSSVEGKPGMDLKQARRLAQIGAEVASLPKGKLAALLREAVGKKNPTPADIEKARIKLPSGAVTTMAEINEAAEFVGMTRVVPPAP